MRAYTAIPHSRLEVESASYDANQEAPEPVVGKARVSSSWQMVYEGLICEGPTRGEKDCEIAWVTMLIAIESEGGR